MMPYDEARSVIHGSDTSARCSGNSPERYDAEDEAQAKSRNSRSKVHSLVGTIVRANDIDRDRPGQALSGVEQWLELLVIALIAYLFRPMPVY